MRVLRQDCLKRNEQLIEMQPKQKKMWEDFVLACERGKIIIPSVDVALDLAVGFQADRELPNPFDEEQTHYFNFLGRAVSYLVQLAIVKERM